MLGIDRRAARAAWTVFLLAALLWTVYLARQTLFVLVLAVFLAYLVYPGVRLLQRRAPRLPRTIAVAIVFLPVIGIIATASTLLGGRISEQATNLGHRLPALLNDPHVTDRIPLPQWMEPLRARIVETVRDQWQGGGDKALPLARRVGLGVVHFAGNLVYLALIPILSFLLINHAGRLREAVLEWITPGPERSLAEAIAEDLNTLLVHYIRALLLLSVATFVMYGVMFWLLDVPYALLLAGIAAPLEFIPFLGPLIAAAIALLVAAFSGYPNVLWIAAFILAYRLFQDYVLNPYLMSEGVEVHPIFVIVGILAGEEIGGVAGMFLAIPLLAAAKIVAQTVRAARPSLS